MSNITLFIGICIYTADAMAYIIYTLCNISSCFCWLVQLVITVFLFLLTDLAAVFEEFNQLRIEKNESEGS